MPESFTEIFPLYIPSFSQEFLIHLYCRIICIFLRMRWESVEIRLATIFTLCWVELNNGDVKSLTIILYNSNYNHPCDTMQGLLWQEIERVHRVKWGRVSSEYIKPFPFRENLMILIICHGFSNIIIIIIIRLRRVLWCSCSPPSRYFGTWIIWLILV